MVRAEPRRVAGHHQPAAGREHSPGGKLELDPVHETPARQVHGVRPAVVQLHELVVLVARQRVEQDFTDDQPARPGRCVGAPGGWGRQFAQRTRAEWSSPLAEAGRWRGELDGVQHLGRVGREEVEPAAFRAEREAGWGFGENQEFARAQHGSSRDSDAAAAGGSTDAAPRGVHRARARVLQFHPGRLARPGRSEDFTDDQAVERAGREGIGGAW